MNWKKEPYLFSLLLVIVMLFGMSSSVLAANYNDVSDSAWYHPAVNYVTEHTLMAGTENDNFEPETPMTRAMLVTILHRMEGSPPVPGNGGFSDMPASNYYTTAVAWAEANHIVVGINGKFEPDTRITREQFATILYRYSNVKGYDTNVSTSFDGYTDGSQISAYAENAMRWVVGRQFMQGSGDKLMPAGYTTRAQAASMLMRFIKNTAPEDGLILSDRIIRITSQGSTATFQLYDTVAAKELYEQLPLELDLTNFRDAQWMFYPPQKLNVTDHETYHDGKKGELSYYEPWGDVFMLYEDFYAGDEMHRLGVCLIGIDEIAHMSGNVRIEKDELILEEDTKMQISIQANENTIVFELNDSPAAKALYAQLPLTIEVEDYSNDEKIFYPPKKLDTANTPMADAELGTLAYYAPWGDVVMFYDSFGSASGLYELGHVVSGSEHISNMSGTIEITELETE